MKILKIIFNGLGAVIRLVPLMPLLFYKRRRGVKAFTSELVNSGLDDEAVKALSSEYKGYFSFFYNLVKQQKGR